MERLLAALPDAGEKTAENVHAIRKLGKSIRGGFALTGLQDTAGRRIQAIGRLLSANRDAVSRQSTWNKLEWNEEPEIAAAITRLLEQQTGVPHPPAETLQWCATLSREAREILDAQEDEALERKASSSAAKLRRKLKKRIRGLNSRTKNEFHETRKALKAHLGALRYLPEAPGPESGAEQLADLLGDENDLATLSAWLETHGFTARLAPGLWKHLRKRTGKIRRKSTKSAKKLFS